MSFMEIYMMMKWIVLLLAFVTFNSIEASNSDEFRLKPNEALQFLYRARRSFLHPGKTKCEEQKREARKAYEEKCTVLGKRFCPKLDNWKTFQQWEIGGGYDNKRNPLPTEATTTPRIQTMRTHRTRLHSPATLSTYTTPLPGQRTMRPNHYEYDDRNEIVTHNPFD